MILSDQLIISYINSLKPHCCVDLIGAEHVTFDLIVHFGMACFTETKTDKIFYVLPHETLDLDHMNF